MGNFVIESNDCRAFAPDKRDEKIRKRCHVVVVESGNVQGVEALGLVQIMKDKTTLALEKNRSVA
jgi:hypothetical protein